jgi:hypothetical protein
MKKCFLKDLTQFLLTVTSRVGWDEYTDYYLRLFPWMNELYVIFRFRWVWLIDFHSVWFISLILLALYLLHQWVSLRATRHHLASIDGCLVPWPTIGSHSLWSRTGNMNWSFSFCLFFRPFSFSMTHLTSPETDVLRQMCRVYQLLVFNDADPRYHRPISVHGNNGWNRGDLFLCFFGSLLIDRLFVCFLLIFFFFHFLEQVLNDTEGNIDVFSTPIKKKRKIQSDVRSFSSLHQQH